MTIKEMLDRAVHRRPDAVVYRYKHEDHWKTVAYRELLARAHGVAEVAAKLGIKPGDKVAIVRENSPEWIELYFGIVGMAATVIPIDVRLQEQEVAHILRDSGARAVFAGVKSYTLLREIEAHLSALGHIVLIGGREIMPVNDCKTRFWDYDELMEKAAEHARSERRAYDRHQPKDDDVASIIYTSGTTGRQKGAMLTHLNLTSNVESVMTTIEVRESDNFLLVLPLHHSFAFTTSLLTPIGAGAEISFVESLKTVGENIREVSPSVICGVPLLFEKMFNRVWNALRENKLAYTLYRLNIRTPVLRGIRKKTGGRLRMMATGGAPIDPDLLVRMIDLGFPMREGYGLTETSPVLTFNPLNKPKPGTVGPALPGVELKIMDPNPEGIGEIAAKGPNVMKGYYNNPMATAEVFSDGWFLTGDMGFLDSEGYLTITGRKKSLIVNREGKNIYPEEVEHQLRKSPLLSEVLVLGYREAGEKVGEHVGVIIVPNQEEVDKLHGHKKLGEKEIAALLRQEVKRLSAEIADYKRPRRIQIRWEEFNKTSLSKVKRYLYTLGQEDLG